MDLAHRYRAHFLNFSGQHTLVSNSHFCGSAGPVHILTATTLLPLASYLGHYGFWALQLAGYVTYGSAVFVIPDDYTFPNSESYELYGILLGTVCVVVAHTVLNDGGRDVYEEDKNRRLRGCLFICCQIR